MKRTSCPSAVLCLSTLLAIGAPVAAKEDSGAIAKSASETNSADQAVITCRLIAISARLQAAVVACDGRQYVVSPGDKVPGTGASVSAVSVKELLLEHEADGGALLVRVPLGSAVPDVISAVRAASDAAVKVPFIQVRAVPGKSE